MTRLTDTAGNYLPIGRLMDEKVVVNGIVSLLATGGSTNLTMHLVAMARAAGIIITGRFLGAVGGGAAAVPHLPERPGRHQPVRAAGGVPLVVRELLQHGLLHEDVHTVAGFGLHRYTGNHGWIMASWRGAKAWPARSTPA